MIEMSETESFPYNIEGTIEKNYEKAIISFLYDNIPEAGNEVAIVMTYDSEYHGLNIKTFDR